MAKEYIERAPVMFQIAGVKILLKGDSDWVSGYRHALQAVGELVQTSPAADVVEVVRCKDCKCGAPFEDKFACVHALPTKNIKQYFQIGTEIVTITDPNDFCSYGERRDNE